jgi:hypothetical protein
VTIEGVNSLVQLGTSYAMKDRGISRYTFSIAKEKSCVDVSGAVIDAHARHALFTPWLHDSTCIGTKEAMGLHIPLEGCTVHVSDVNYE